MSNDKRFCAGFPMTNGVPGKIAMLTGKHASKPLFVCALDF